MRILLDFDDVCNDLLPAWLKFLNDKYNSDIKVEDITDWDMAKCTYPKLPVYEDGSHPYIYEPLYYPEFWDTVAPKEGAIEGIKKLMETNEVFITTASHYATIGPKVERCMMKHFPYLDWKQIISISNKEMLKADVLIDDNHDNVEKFIQNNPYGYGIIFDALYNRYPFDTNPFNKEIRVYNWNEILSKIDFLKKINNWR